MINCPLPNSKEWKMLVSQTGESLAKLAFIANGYAVPNVTSLTDIKKAIGFKTNVENFASIAKKLKAYNKINGTSHSFEKERIYGNTFKLTLKPNYLSVNLEKQRIREQGRNDLFRVEGEVTTRGFENLYAYTPSKSERESG